MMKRACVHLIATMMLGGLTELGMGAEGMATNAPPFSLEQVLRRDYLLGDWGGVRTDLSKRGLDFEFLYFASRPANLSGGLGPGSVYEGAMLMTFDVDTDKLAGWKGGQFHAGSAWLHGKRFSPNYVGDLNVVNLVDFDHGLRLWELWYQQQFLSGKLSLKLGQLAVDRDFLVPEYYSSLASISLLNQTFFFPTMAFNVYDIAGFPRGKHALASTPYGAPGVRIRWDPVPALYVQAGVYDGYPDLKPPGTRIRLADDEGALAYFEAGYRRNPGQGDKGLPGVFKVGAYLHTDDFLDIYDTMGGLYGFTAGTQPPHAGNYGVYFLADQMLYRERDKDDPAQQGLVGFFRVAAAPKDRNLAQLGIDGGLVYRGLIPRRDYDTLGLAVSYLEISDAIRRAQQAANIVAPGSFVVSDYEGVLEFNYRAQMTAWWTLQSSIQRIFHPGGSKAIPDAWAFILQTTLRF